MSNGELDFVATNKKRKAPQRPEARTTGARFVGARLTCQQLVLPGLALLAPPCSKHLKPKKARLCTDE
jgi:hypothetical protein